MPTYLSRSGNGYIFRRAIPAPLRKILVKREIKIPLGTTSHRSTRTTMLVCA